MRYLRLLIITFILWCNDITGVQSAILLEADSCVARAQRKQPRVDVDSLLSVLIDQRGYDFINLAADTIINYSDAPNYIRPIINLDQKGQKYVIIHYGDSHIHAGIIPQVVKKCVQYKYGNAGPGLIVPYTLSKAGYEPKWYEIDILDGEKDQSLNSKCVGAKIVGRKVDSALEPGLSGICFGYDQNIEANSQSMPEDLVMNITTRSKSLGDILDCSDDNMFSSVRVFHDSLAPIFRPLTAKDNKFDVAGIDTISYLAPEPSVLSTSIHMGSGLTNNARLMLTNDNQFSLSRGRISALSLERDEPGVLYHSMGVSSACAVHWARYSQVLESSMMLEPNLIIVSLGSNEAAGGNFIDKVFYDQIHMMISRLRLVNPSASVLLTTPAQVYKYSRRTGSVPNANYARVAEVIKNYAKDHGLAVFDLYGMTSAQGSAKQWYKHGLLRRDKLHFTSDGYQIQGLLLWRALEREFEAPR